MIVTKIIYSAFEQLLYQHCHNLIMCVVCCAVQSVHTLKIWFCSQKKS